jgi:hypothetical protein
MKAMCCLYSFRTDGSLKMCVGCKGFGSLPLRALWPAGVCDEELGEKEAQLCNQASLAAGL